MKEQSGMLRSKVRGKQEVKEGRGLHPGRLVVGSVVMPQVISFQRAPRKGSFVELLTEEDLESSIPFVSMVQYGFRSGDQDFLIHDPNFPGCAALM